MIDSWAAKNENQEIFGQIGQTKYRPKHFEYTKNLTPKDYRQKIEGCSIIVGHVGMGTIISGIEVNKPLILMPRHQDQGEHRNDHQLATAKHFSKLPLINIIEDIKDFDTSVRAIRNDLRNASNAGLNLSPSSTSPNLLKTISNFIIKD